jgi:FtsH-binding integral membrane protein
MEMNQNFTQTNVTPTNVGLNFLKIFGFFALGLLITAAGCFGFSYLWINVLPTMDDGSATIWFIVIFAVSFIGALITGFIVGRNTQKTNGLSIIPFSLYCVFYSILFSSFTLLLNDPNIIGSALAITSALFLIMGLFGFLFKGKVVGIVLGVATSILIGAGIFYLINYFWLLASIVGNADFQVFFWMYFGIEMAYLVVMLLYTSVDIYRIKTRSQNMQLTTNESIYWSMVLYSDFITILIYIIRLLILSGLKNND